ncbi:MAG: hypothetical protein Kow00129_08380 [Thermoleophilia bacterium]
MIATKSCGMAGGQVPVVTWSGEVDRFWLSYLGPELTNAWSSAQRRRVMLDLRRVTYLDGGGLQLILRLLDRCRPGEWIGVVADPDQPVLRLLALARVTTHPNFRLSAKEC